MDLINNRIPANIYKEELVVLKDGGMQCFHTNALATGSDCEMRKEPIAIVSPKHGAEG